MNIIAINNVGYQVQSFEVVDWVIEKQKKWNMNRSV